MVSAQGAEASLGKPKPKATKGKESVVDLSDIHLDGEEDDLVPIYDTPAEIRRKIRQYQTKTTKSKAQLNRELNAQLHDIDSPKVSAASFDNFMKRKSTIGGAKSIVFYAAYVYFEKLRLKERKPKSKKREEMEQVWGYDGVNRTIDDNTRFIAHKADYAGFDKNGKFWIQRGNR